MCLYFINWINLQFRYILLKNQKAEKRFCFHKSKQLYHIQCNISKPYEKQIQAELYVSTILCNYRFAMRWIFSHSRKTPWCIAKYDTVSQFLCKIIPRVSVLSLEGGRVKEYMQLIIRRDRK